MSKFLGKKRRVDEQATKSEARKKLDNQRMYRAGMLSQTQLQ